MERKRVYLVDDDMITLFGVKKLLGRIDYNFDILEFGNGKTALAAVLSDIDKKTLPDVIFLDINMPVMDGWQFLEAFLQLPIKQKILINILTSSIDIADRNKWEHYQMKSHHKINFKNKPIYHLDVEDITLVNMAS